MTRTGDERARALVRTMPTALLVLDRELTVVDANDAYLELVGRTLDEVVGRHADDVLPPGPEDADRRGVSAVRSSVERVLASGEPHVVPAFRPAVADAGGRVTERWWSLVHFPVLDASGRVQLVAQRVDDVTELVLERRRSAQLAERDRVTERERAGQAREVTQALRAEELASRRVTSLADVALTLATAAAVEDLPRIVGDGLSVLEVDGCGVALPSADGGWRFVAGPKLAADAQTAVALLPYDSRMPAAVAARTGKPFLLLSREAGLAYDAEVMQGLFDATGCEAWACVPLRGTDEVLGVLSVAWTEARTLSVEELALLDGFGAQLAQAVQRLTATAAQQALARRAQRLSETLQRSLLTTPLKHELLDIAVRYLPAAEEAQVGGDWYDAFVTHAGRTLLVVGDVSGHDRAAAAMMGQVRNLLRGLAFDSDDGPAALLSRLDAALDGLDLETLVTCVLVSVEATDGVCRIRWSNAGHLAPFLRRPDGTVAPLHGEHDLLLGLDPATERHEGEIDLPVDSVLLLCTDGLVERRAATLDEGLGRLAAAMREGPGADPEGLCEHVLAALDDGRIDDDIALLVARVRSC